MYAYKRGDYQRCLQLSTQNVHTLLYVHRMSDVLSLPEFMQLLDDDIVSLSALMLIVIRQYSHTRDSRCVLIFQLTLSLYLMTQCQLRLHHSVTSLAGTLQYIKVAQRRLPSSKFPDLLTLKMIKRKIVAHLRSYVG